MENTGLANKLMAFRDDLHIAREQIDSLEHEIPFERIKRNVKEELAEEEEYRVSILRNLSILAGIGEDAIITAAKSLHVQHFKKGDIILEENEIGDAFFILEEGVVSVTIKTIQKDKNEASNEIYKLERNSYFGEAALLSSPQPATITVISEEAKCLRMSKSVSDELVSAALENQSSMSQFIGEIVLNQIQLFNVLTYSNKQELLSTMSYASFLPNRYICRQGIIGNRLYILIKGTCRVTVNTSEGIETEVSLIRPGDYFDEQALIDLFYKRPHNVITLEAVTCLSLHRTAFHELLKKLKVLNFYLHLMSPGPETKHRSSTGFSTKRRISSLNIYGQKDEGRVQSLFKRLSKFFVESKWNSLYGRLYKEVILHAANIIEYGDTIKKMITSPDSSIPNRSTASDTIRTACLNIDKDPSLRSTANVQLIFGLLSQRNILRDKICHEWPRHVFQALCKTIQIISIKPFEKINTESATKSCAYVILRGCVRILERTTSGRNQNQLYYKEDLCSGEMFDEDILTGNHTRIIEAQAMSDVDLAVVEYVDFMRVQGREASGIMSVDNKIEFLRMVSIFRSWDEHLIAKVAAVAMQKEVNKGVVLTVGGGGGQVDHSDDMSSVCSGISLNSSNSLNSNHSIHFRNNFSSTMVIIIHGKVDVLDSMSERHLIATLSRYNFFNESELINAFVRDAHDKVTERFTTIAATPLDVLVISTSDLYRLFTAQQVEDIRHTFMSKQQFRLDSKTFQMSFSDEITSAPPSYSNVKYSSPSSPYLRPRSPPSPLFGAPASGRSRSTSLGEKELAAFQQKNNLGNKSPYIIQSSNSRPNSPGFGNNTETRVASPPPPSTFFSVSLHCNIKPSAQHSLIHQEAVGHVSRPHTANLQLQPMQPNRSSQFIYEAPSTSTGSFSDRKRVETQHSPRNRPERVGLPSVDNSNLLAFHSSTKPPVKKANDVNGDDFYIRYLLSPPIVATSEPVLSVERESTGSVTSRQAPKDISATNRNNRPNTAKVGLTSDAGCFPLVSRQAGLRQYVKPLRELHVLPSIIALEEKIGQRHITNILDCHWKHEEDVDTSAHGDILIDIPNTSTHQPFNSVKGTSPSSNKKSAMKDMKLPYSPNNSRTVTNVVPNKYPLKTSRDRVDVRNRNTERRKTAGQSRQEITTSTPKKSTFIPLNRNGSANGFLKASPADLTLPPPSVEAFFKPVVHPDGVFSTPVLEISDMSRASTSVNDFLSRLSSSSRNNNISRK